MDPIATAQYGMFAAAQQFVHSDEPMVRAGGDKPSEAVRAAGEPARPQAALPKTGA